MKPRRTSGVAVGVAMLAYVFAMPSSEAQEAPKPLPEPLTLDYALSLVEEAHPELLRARADLLAAQAELDAAQSSYGIETGVVAGAGWIEPPETLAAQGNEDHRVLLAARKRLYDFGRTRSLTEAAQSAIQAGEWGLIDARNRLRIEIMARYFEVLLADLEYARDNEAMAVGFIAYDRLRERYDLGQRSEVELLESASAYQETRHARFASQARQRATRARLALALNRPKDLPAQLLPPALEGVARELPEVAKLQEAALQNNPGLIALRTRLDAARQRLAAARSGNRPYIDAEAGVGAYSRELGSSNLFAGGLTLTIPLYQGGKVGAAIAREQARIQQLEAEQAAREYEVRQAVLDTWLELDNLRVRREQMTALMDYREMYLDRARTLYDQEVRADLGDAMVQFTDATLRKARANYQTMLAWAKLEALTGKNNGESSETLQTRASDGSNPADG